MSLDTYDSFQLGRTPKHIPADPDSPAKIINLRGAPVLMIGFQTTDRELASRSGVALGVGQSCRLEGSLWITSEHESSLMVERP